MKDYRVKRVMNLAFLMATTGALVLLLNVSVQAQRNPIDVFNAERARQRAEAEQRRALEHVKDGDRKPPVTDQRLRISLMAQIREDFHRIQVNNKEMIRVAFAGQPLDYGAISEKASEIRKRATRLGEIIKFYELKDERKIDKYRDVQDGEQLKASLLVLGTLIRDFVNNPFFQQKPGVLDIQQSAKASRDLRDIIELSEIIKKNAKRLEKASR